MEKFSGRFYVVFIAALWVAVVLIHCLCAIFICRDGVK